jgi:hypothetical protein
MRRRARGASALRESELSGVIGGDRDDSRRTHVKTIVLEVDGKDSIENVKSTLRHLP